MKFGIPLLGAALFFGVATLSLDAEAGCGDVYGGGGYASVGYDTVVYAPGPPPSARREIVPRSPGWGFVWTSGYWVYVDVGWSWVPGTWRRPPNRATTVWYTPRYRYDRGRYVYTDGGWGDRRRVRNVVRHDYRRVDHRRYRDQDRQRRIYKEKKRLERQRRQVREDRRQLERERRQIERDRRDNDRRVKKNNRRHKKNKRDRRGDRRNERVARR